jgi:hypothetical protein
MLSEDNVSTLGGVQQIESLLDERLSGSDNRGGGTVIVQVENFIGQPEFVREVAVGVKQELGRW